MISAKLAKEHAMTANLVTLGQIRAAHPCGSGWKTLLGKTGQSPEAANLDLVLSIGDIALANGTADALWAARLVDDRRAVLRAIMPAVRRAAVHTQDVRVHDCIAAINGWIGGDENVDLAAQAEAAAEAAWEAAAEAEERERQVADIIAEFPLHFFNAMTANATKTQGV